MENIFNIYKTLKDNIKIYFNINFIIKLNEIR